MIATKKTTLFIFLLVIIGMLLFIKCDIQPKNTDKLYEKKMLSPFQRITNMVSYCINGKCSAFCEGFINGIRKDIYEKKDLYLRKSYQVVVEPKAFDKDSIVMVQFDFLGRYLSNCYFEKMHREKLDRKTVLAYQRKFGQKLTLADLFIGSLTKTKIDHEYACLEITKDILDTSLDLAFDSKLDPNDGYLYYHFDNYPQIDYSRRCSGDCGKQYINWIKANGILTKEEPFVK